MRWLSVLVALTTAATAPSAPSSDTAATAQRAGHVQVLAINDFHGALEPPAGSGGEIAGRQAGGAAYLATHLKRLREGHPDTVTVGAGDLVGGSPLTSAHFHDEPTVAALDAMGLRVTAMGNHELDEGPQELLRLQGKARLRWLAANTLRDGKPLLPAFSIERVGGRRIGFVGLTLEDTPLGVAPGGTDGLTFADEADTANLYARELKRRGADAVFLLLHEGGEQTGDDPNGCDGFSGAAKGIAERLSADVDAVATAHTHGAYVCDVAGKPVASASSNGRLVTDWDLGFDGDGLASVTARNVVVTRDVPPDPQVQGIVERARQRIAPLANRVVGHLDEDLDREEVGTVIADADLAATRHLGADAGLMNRAGIRNNVVAGDVTYAEAFDVLPFSHDVVVRTYTGAQLRDVLAQQDGRLGLALSSNLDGDGDEVSIDGDEIDDDERVQIAMNRFLAEGGDGYSALEAGTPPVTGPVDVDAFAAGLRGL